jgi:hypothetical protein
MEAISHSKYSLNILWFAWVSFNFRAKIPDVNIEGPVHASKTAIGEPVNQLGPIEHLAGRAHQDRQQAELNGRQGNRLAI